MIVGNELIEEAGKVAVMKTLNGNVIFQKEEVEKIGETILFLKIHKGGDEKYLADLEVKTEIDNKPVIRTVTQNQTITIDQKLFEDLHRFAAHRRGRPHTRKTGETVNFTEQIQLEKQLGIEIYNTFFHGDPGKIFEDFFSLLMRNKIKRLLLVIGSDIPAVLNIPFELMRKDMESEPFILTSDGFLLTHTIEAGLSDFDIKGVDPLAPPLRLLFVSALPVDLPEDERFLELEREQELLIEAVGSLVSGKKVMVDFLDIASLDEIEKSLSRGEHHIVHFSGHGVHWEDEELEAGLLFMENEDGTTFAVTGEELAESLKKFSSIKLVVLSACETARAETYGVAGALIKNGIPSVLAMRYPVGDETATIFTSNFYEGICTGKSLDHSMFCARKAVWDNERKQMESLAKSGDLQYFTSEWMTPFLYLNQPIHRLVDFSKKATNTAYFFQKPSFRPIEGGKFVGYGFIGRRREIIGLSNRFKKEKRCICIYGQGGIGKTTLAIRFADNFENGSYQIIQFRGEVTEEKILTGLADRAQEILGDKIVEMIKSPDLSPESKLNVLMEQYLSREKVIILFDNFEDNQVKSKRKKIYRKEIHSGTLKPFLAQLCKNIKRSSYILFTTRYRFPEPEVEGFNLGEMTFPDSFKLINRFERLVSLGTEEKREIHRKLGGHPRALELLDGYFKKEKIAWEDVAAGFKDVEEKEINHDLLLDMLWKRLNRTERQVLKAASVFREMTAFAGLEKVTGMKTADVRNVLASLNDFSLAYLEKDTFNIHRLTSTFVTTSKMKKNERKKTHILAAEYLYSNHNKAGKKYLSHLFEARWHFLQAEEWDRASELTFSLERYLTKTGFPQLSLELLTEVTEKNVNEENRADVYHLQGNLFMNFGDYDEALKLYERSMGIYEKIGDNQGISYSTGQIGMIYQHKGNYDQALKQYEKAVKISEKIGDIRGVSYSVHEVGTIFQDKGDLDKALKQYEKSMEIAKRIGDMQLFSTSMLQKGMLNQYRGDYDNALGNYQRAIEIFGEIKDIKNVAECFHHIGMIYESKEDYEKALEYFEKAIEIRSKIGYLKGFSESLAQKGIIYQHKGDYLEALKHYREALGIFKKIGDTKKVATCLHNIGNIYYLKRSYDEALTFYEESLSIKKEIRDNAGTAITLAQIGKLCFDKEDYTKALRLFVNAFLIFSKLRSPDVEPTENYILKIQDIIPDKQFNNVLKEFGLPPDFSDGLEKKREKLFNDFLFNITSEAVKAKKESKVEKEKVITNINDIVDQLKEEEPDAVTLTAYFQILLAYIADKEIEGYKEKVPPGLYEMFEKAQEQSGGRE